MPASYSFVVRGRVQGVGFRWHAVAQARDGGLDGWIRNREDGGVEGLASGAPDALERFRDWLHRGPPAARVTQVDWSPSSETPPPGFAVKR